MSTLAWLLGCGVLVLGIDGASDPFERAWRALHEADDPRAALAALRACDDVDPATPAGLRVELLGLEARARLGERDAVRERAFALRTRALRSPLLTDAWRAVLDAADVQDATPAKDAIAPGHDRALPTHSNAPDAPDAHDAPDSKGEPAPEDPLDVAPSSIRLLPDVTPVDDAHAASADANTPARAVEPPAFVPPPVDSGEAWHAALDAHERAWTFALERAEGRLAPVVALLGRRRALDLGLPAANAYELCTYSFVHASRRDSRAVGNRWELQYGNTPGRIHVRMTSSQRHALAVCGVTDWPLRPAGLEPTIATDERVDARAGDVFVERLAWASEGAAPAFLAFQVLAVDDDAVLVLRWELLDDARVALVEPWFSAVR